MNKFALSVKSLTKVYKQNKKKLTNVKALNNINLNVNRGEHLVYWALMAQAKQRF